MKPPIVSIIIPTYNAASTLEETFKSIISQTYSHYEILVIDGKSTDPTLDIVRKYDTHIKKWISEKDQGIYDAMNKGIEMAKGDYLYFMGSDDVFYSDRVLESLFMEAGNLNYEVVYGNVIKKSKGIVYDGEFNPLKLKEKNICHQAIFTHRRVFDKIGKFNTRYKILADWDFNIRWFTNKNISRRFVHLTIAVYNDISSSSGYFEEGFYKYKDELLDKYIYSWHFLMYKKILSFLRKTGAWLKKFVLFV
jgi:glycosyltransferase involved in cell wall biosynthesis